MMKSPLGRLKAFVPPWPFAKKKTAGAGDMEAESSGYAQENDSPEAPGDEADGAQADSRKPKADKWGWYAACREALARKRKDNEKPKKKFAKNKLFIPGKADLMKCVYGVLDEVEAKQCEDVIFFKCAHKLGDDFYFVYSYDADDKQLRYIATPSDKYLAGKVPVLAYALKFPGLYLLSSLNNGDGGAKDGVYTVVDTREGVKIRSKHTLREDEMEAPGLIQIMRAQKPAKEMAFKWSLHRQSRDVTVMTTLIVLVLAVTMLVGNIVVSQKQTELTAAQRDLKGFEGKLKKLPNLIPFMNTVENALQETGLMTKIVKEGQGLTFYVRFKDSAKAQVFQSKLAGSRIEGDRVIYTVQAF